MDPYRVLGLESGASQADVKRAYRRLAKALHPDAAGEGALPRFLELQDAYEQLTGTRVRTVRAPGSSSGATGAAAGGAGARPGPMGSGSAGAEGFREPWRADPSRARAAREQARNRRARTGDRPGWGTDSASGAAAPGASRPGAGRPGATPPGGATHDRQPGAGRSRSGSSAGPTTSTDAASRAEGSSGEGPSAGAQSSRRRRASRKATLGSTSYDEAREPTDRSWAGASWYGPTTGEYWIVNPREYADPRKHGPGYTSRGRGDQPPAAAPTTGAPSAPSAPSAPGARSAPGAATDRTTRAAAPSTGASARRGSDAVVDPDTPVADARTASGAATDPPVGADRGDSGSGLDGVLGAFRISHPDRWRRLGLVLLAWPPLGLAAATAIGQATGCLSYSTSCNGTDRALPWLAQAVLLGLLFASPWLTRVLGAGTIAALVALVPAVGIITALGGASSADGRPVLAGWLALAWLAGVAVGARRALGGSRDAGLSNGGSPEVDTR